MQLKNILAVILLLWITGTVKAQPGETIDFDQYAQQQNRLFVEAYQKKDVKQYNVLLKDFLKRYAALPSDRQKEFAPFYVNVYYNLSCTYSLLNDKPMALSSLAEAIKAGYADYSHISVDSDLDNIRNEASFKSMIQPLREVGDYLYILKKDNNRFTDADSFAIPPFTYESADHPDLVRLRKQYKLDSVAGSGNEISRMINILQWVHNTIPHDGQHESGIKAVNGFEIATVANAKHIGVSCGELATVLNDCYLAMGFKSRKIYCLPKDSLSMDFDSHVINAVYSNELKKWVWMDPTHEAYVMNEKGEVLGIGETRERLINDQPLILNPVANWNRRISTVKENYLYSYMAKNLYRFYCTLHSGFDVETRGGDRTITYVNLVPTGYGKFKQMPFKKQFYNKELKTNFIHYTIHNPSSFWQVPGS